MTNDEIKNVLFLEIICPGIDYPYEHTFDIDDQTRDTLKTEYLKNKDLVAVFKQLPVKNKEDQERKDKLIKLGELLNEDNNI